MNATALLKTSVRVGVGTVALTAFSFISNVASSDAANITSLSNTGVDATGTPLADMTIGDPHYQIISAPGGSTTTIRVRTAASNFPIPPWIGNNPTSAWIGPNNANNLDGPVGDYTYRTTFDLTGFVPSTAQITGQWSADNRGIRILLNGVDTLNPPTPFNIFNTGFEPFSINSGFIPGINILDFVVSNTAGSAINPTGLRVEMVGHAEKIPTPALLPGLIGMGAAAIRKKAKKTGSLAD